MQRDERQSHRGCQARKARRRAARAQGEEPEPQAGAKQVPPQRLCTRILPRALEAGAKLANERAIESHSGRQVRKARRHAVRAPKQEAERQARKRQRKRECHSNGAIIRRGSRGRHEVECQGTPARRARKARRQAVRAPKEKPHTEGGGASASARASVTTPVHEAPDKARTRQARRELPSARKSQRQPGGTGAPPRPERPKRRPIPRQARSVRESASVTTNGCARGPCHRVLRGGLQSSGEGKNLEARAV